MANKITQTGSPKDFVDHSYFYKPYMIPAVLGFILWAAYVCWTGYWGIVHGRVPVIDIGIQIGCSIPSSPRPFTAWKMMGSTC